MASSVALAVDTYLRAGKERFDLQVDDVEDAFIDPAADDYEEVADLDEDDEAPMSSDDEDEAEDEAMDGDGTTTEDRDAAASTTIAPPRDDAECVAATHDAPVYAVAWSNDGAEATVVAVMSLSLSAPWRKSAQLRRRVTAAFKAAAVQC